MLPVALSEYLRLLKSHEPSVAEEVLMRSLREQGWNEVVIQEAVAFYKTGINPTFVTLHAREKEVSLPLSQPYTQPHSISPASSTVTTNSVLSPTEYISPSLPPELSDTYVTPLPKPTLPPELVSEPAILIETIIPKSPAISVIPLTESVDFVTSKVVLPEGQAASDAVGIVRAPKFNVMQREPTKKIEYINPETAQDERDNPTTFLKEGYRYTATWLTYLYLLPAAFSLPTVSYFSIRRSSPEFFSAGNNAVSLLLNYLSPRSTLEEIPTEVLATLPSLIFVAILLILLTLFVRRAFVRTGTILISFLSGNALYVLVSIGVVFGIHLVRSSTSIATSNIYFSHLQSYTAYTLFFGLIAAQVLFVHSLGGTHTVQRRGVSALMHISLISIGILVALYTAGAFATLKYA